MRQARALSLSLSLSYSHTHTHLGARDEPGALRGKDDREDKVLMALEGVAALGTRWVALPS